MKSWTKRNVKKKLISAETRFTMLQEKVPKSLTSLYHAALQQIRPFETLTFQANSIQNFANLWCLLIIDKISFLDLAITIFHLKPQFLAISRDASDEKNANLFIESLITDSLFKLWQFIHLVDDKLAEEKSMFHLRS